MQILFANSHPVVEEDVERLKSIAAATSKHKKFNLDWEEEPQETHPKWLKQHWAMMQELQAGSLQKHKHHVFFLISQKQSKNIFQEVMIFVPLIDFPKTVKVNPLALQPLRESHQVVRSQRVQHALDIFNTAGDFETKFINTSQSINRMASGRDDVIPCITPSGDFFSMRHKRYLTGLVLKYFCSNIMF